MMKNGPRPSESAILECLRKSYEIYPTRLELLRAGDDASAVNYRAATADGSWFVKVRTSTGSAAPWEVPSYLSGKGIEEVVAPLATRENARQVELSGHVLSVYPFLDGARPASLGMTPAQWRRFGRVLRTIHRATIPAGLKDTIARETFLPAWAAVVRRLDGMVASTDHPVGLERELASLWRSHRELILRCTDRTVELGKALARRSSPMVLCHSDIHTDNLLVDASDGLHVVDWDGILLAPVERDLVFVADVVGGRIVTDHPERRWFFEGYGEVRIDPRALSYYQYEWVVQEIGDYGQRVLVGPPPSEEIREAAVVEFRKIFEPGDVMDRAFRGDAEHADDRDGGRFEGMALPRGE